MLPPFFLSVLFCFIFSFYSLFAQSGVPLNQDLDNPQEREPFLTVGEYYQFLNDTTLTSSSQLNLENEVKIAVSTSEDKRFLSSILKGADFYDERIKSDLITIAWRGNLDSHYYEMSKKDSNMPMTFISWKDLSYYCYWKNKTKATSLEDFAINISSEHIGLDLELKSNAFYFLRHISEENYTLKNVQTRGMKLAVKAALLATVAELTSSEPRAFHLDQEATPRIEEGTTREPPSSDDRKRRRVTFEESSEQVSEKDSSLDNLHTFLHYSKRFGFPSPHPALANDTFKKLKKYTRQTEDLPDHYVIPSNTFSIKAQKIINFINSTPNLSDKENLLSLCTKIKEYEHNSLGFYHRLIEESHQEEVSQEAIDHWKLAIKSASSSAYATLKYIHAILSNQENLIPQWRKLIAHTKHAMELAAETANNRKNGEAFANTYALHAAQLFREAGFFLFLKIKEIKKLRPKENLIEDYEKLFQESSQNASYFEEALYAVKNNHYEAASLWSEAGEKQIQKISLLLDILYNSELGNKSLIIYQKNIVLQYQAIIQCLYIAADRSLANDSKNAKEWHALAYCSARNKALESFNNATTACLQKDETLLKYHFTQATDYSFIANNLALALNAKEKGNLEQSATLLEQARRTEDEADQHAIKQFSDFLFGED